MFSALALRNDFIEANPRATEAILMAVMEAAQWADAAENKEDLLYQAILFDAIHAVIVTSRLERTHLCRQNYRV